MINFGRGCVLVGACLAALAAAPATAQQASFNFNPTQALQWIPISTTDTTGIVIPIVINGKTVKAVIDSGSKGPQALTISQKLQAELRLTPTSSNTASAYGGSIREDIVTLASIQIGGLTLNNQSVSAAPGEFSSDGDVEVIINQQLLLGMLMQVDWGGHRLRFLLTGDMPKASDDIPVLIDQRTHHLVVPTVLCGMNRQFLLDTGLEDDVHINVVDTAFGNCAGAVHSDMAASGLGGRHIKEMASLSSIQLGGQIFPQIVAGLEDRDDPLVTRGLAGSVGYGVLRRSDFVLDAGGGRLRFYGPYRFGKKIERPTIGVQFKVTPNALTITHLMSNSPASRTSLEVNSRICKVNGRTIDDWKGAYPMRPPVGTKVSLELCDGQTVDVTAEDFLAPPPLPGALPPETHEPAGIGAATQALAACAEATGQVAIDGCSTVIGTATILAYYRMTAQLLRAQLYEKQGKPDLARGDFEQVLRIDPTNAGATAGLQRLTSDKPK